MLTSHKLRKKEHPAEGVRRIAISLNKLAVRNIDKYFSEDPHEAVHELRKRFKEMRAILRLVKKELGEEIYERENTFYRDLGRRISEIRDFKAFQEALDLISEQYGGQLDKKAFAATESFLKKKLAEKEKEIKLTSTLKEIKQQLLEQEPRLKEWPLKFRSYKTLTLHIREIYNKGNRQLKIVKVKPDMDNIHEWRKQSKYLTYQLSIITNIWSQVMNTLEKEFHRLADITGDEHDLAEFHKILEHHMPDQEEYELLKAIINDRRAVLQQEALTLGKKLYSEAAANLEARINAYWRIYENSYP